MKDMQITLLKTQKFSPSILGVTRATGMQLLQKILILLLSDSSLLYRLKDGTTLVSCIKGSNIPSDSVLTLLGTNCCVQVRSLLLALLASLISDLSAQALDGMLSITLTLTDGTKYTAGNII